MAEAAESGAPEGLLVAFPALVLGPGSGLQPNGQVRPPLQDGIKRIGTEKTIHKNSFLPAIIVKRAGIFNFANLLREKKKKKQIEQGHVIGKASILTLLGDLSLVGLGLKF